MRRVVCCAALLAAAGCGGKPTASSADSGAKAAAQTFFEALVAHDRPRAYEVLDPESQRRFPPAQFAQLARAYSSNLRFQPERVIIRACEEQGDSATAHVVLMGHGAGHSRRYLDGATLRRTDGRWGIVLPANFGRNSR